MSTAVILAWIKEAHAAYDALGTFDSHASAARRAASGKKPYKASGKVGAQLKKLDQYTKKIEPIGSKGLGKPDHDLTFKELGQLISLLEGDDKKREEAVRLFHKINLSRVGFVQHGESLLAVLQNVAAEAGARRDAAVKIRDMFYKLARTFPDPTGSTIKIQLIDCMNAFEAAGGALARLASAASKGVKRVAKEIEPVKKQNTTFYDTFEQAYEASEKARR